MTRERSQNEDALQGAPANRDVQDAPVVAGRTGVSAASAARTRTLGGETVEFTAADYQAPQGVAGTAPRAVEPAVGAKLGKAQGVSSLRTSRAAARGGEAAELSGRFKLAIAGALVLVAVVVFVGGYFWAKSLITSLNNPAPAANSVNYATDAYTVFAVTGEDGALEAAYLAYVDSINERVELARLAPNTYCSTKYPAADGAFENDLAQIYAARGLAGLVEGIASVTDVAIVAALSLDAGEMDRVLELPRGAGAQGVSALAAELWDEGQQITLPALQGLLVTIKQIPAENHLVLTAPTDPGVFDGEQLEVLRPQEWLVMARGMRDPASDVSLAS